MMEKRRGEMHAYNNYEKWNDKMKNKTATEWWNILKK